MCPLLILTVSISLLLEINVPANPPTDAPNNSALVDPEYNAAEGDFCCPPFVVTSDKNKDINHGAVRAKRRNRASKPYSIGEIHHFRWQGKWWKSKVAGGYQGSDCVSLFYSLSCSLLMISQCETCTEMDIDCVFFCQRHEEAVGWSSRCSACFMFDKACTSNPANAYLQREVFNSLIVALSP